MKSIRSIPRVRGAALFATAIAVVVAASPAHAQTAGQGTGQITGQAPGKATGQTAAQAEASRRATDECAALAKKQDIRLGKLESVLTVAPGVFDVRYARPFFGKPQLCRYEELRKTATFAGGGGIAALPAPLPPDNQQTRTAALQACVDLVTAKGEKGASGMMVTPVPGGFYDVKVGLGQDASKPFEMCRYDARTSTAALR